MKVFVPKESSPGESRVAATPETVRKMKDAGFTVHVETGAGAESHVPDASFEAAGAQLVERSFLADADIVLTVDALPESDAEQLKESALLVGFLAPHARLDLVEKLQERKVSTLAMELVPRISRAQKMDALSSQASLGGYKAVLLAAARLDKYFPLLMTAAGTVQPAKVVVLGAGVAGLQAIATAKRLGAIVEVSDIREEVKEQVESLGGRFIELPMKESGAGEGGYAKEVTPEFLRKQQEIVAKHLSAADVAITTALVPGKRAPKLITQAMVEGMRPGAVIVDMAVSQGGNCELSKAGEDVDHNGVIILGPANLPATVPADASLLYARNVWALLSQVAPKGELTLDLEDAIVDGALLTHAGEVRHAPTVAALKDRAAA